MQVKHVTSLDPTAIEPLASLLTSAFADDEFYGTMYGAVPDPKEFNELRFRSRVYESVRDDEVYVIEAAGLPAAMMIVVPPGSRGKRDPTPYSDELATATPSATAEAEKRYRDAVDELETDAFGDDTYYISFLATAMWARGKGLAGVLLKHILDKACAEGRLTTVTASAEYNIPMYEKFGFKVIQQSSVKIDRQKIELWAMDNAESEGHL